MEKLSILFGYVHYRIYSFFKKKGDNVPEWKGTVILSLMQTLTLVDLMVIGKMFFGYPLPTKYIVLPPLILFGINNWYKYERNFNVEEIESRLCDETRTKRKVRGWLIALYLITSFLIPTMYGFVMHNLH